MRAQAQRRANVGPGTKLGPYEITSPLGAGGMGEVFRAQDTRLGRTVAIKVLPQQLSQMPDLEWRLNHEARAIARLAVAGLVHRYTERESLLRGDGARAGYVFVLTGREQPERIFGLRTQSNLLEMLGAKPLFGRLLE